VKSNMEDRTFAVNRAGISVGAMAPPAAGGLPALQTHDAQSAHHFTAINPLHGVSANAAQEHNRRKDVELQQLSGASSLHPLLSDYRNETESRFMKSNIMQRIIVAVCVLLTALLCGMVAYEVNEVIKESSERLTAQGGESSQHWTVADCHWTQIRLPTSLSAADVTVQVKFRQPSAPYEIIEEFAELGREYNYCFLVDTQGANPVIGAALEDTDERGTIKTTGQTGIYVMLFKHPLHSSKEIGTLKIFFRKTSPSARLAPAPMEIQAVAEEVECWKECIEYNSVCDDEFAHDQHSPRRSLQQYPHRLYEHVADDRPCEEIQTCVDQKYMHNCGWCQTGTSIVSGHGISCERDELLPDFNCIPKQQCFGFWTWQSGSCPKVGNGVCVLKVVCKRYRKTCVGYHEVEDNPL